MLIKSKIMLGLGILSLFTFSSPAFSDISVSKTDWLKSFKALAPEAMCKGIMSGEKTGNLLKDNNISLEKCKPLITQSLDRCLDKYASQMPTTIGATEGKNYGEKLGRCSGEDFYSHYIAKT